jgi:diguanylate cyclase (GGDEF)-like protein
MKKPERPQDETARVKTLRSLNVLDTLAEERFDRLTRLAKRMFDVPIALVSLVDANRQWFKSCIGLCVDETARDISFCGHAILGREIFVIPDATRDERFADNPLVSGEPHIRFYAGCPLRYLDGSTLGTLCIIDSRPRALGEDDLEALRDLATLAENELAALQLATQDELTQIPNRRGFLSLASNSLDICARQCIPASMVLFDLNGFKLINDTFGHAEGDRALAVFADHMKATFRESDVPARLGGDEFAVLLTDTSIEPAQKTIGRLRDSIQHHNRQATIGYAISFSEGIVPVDFSENPTVESLLGQPDSLMYARKLASAKNPGY